MSARGEVCGLRWDDVDFGARELTVRRSLEQAGKTLHVAPPKTAHGIPEWNPTST